MNSTAKDLFQLQTELVDMKVDMAVSKSIGLVLERIDTGFKEVDGRLISLKEEMVAVKTRLNMHSETKSIVRARFIDYTFKTGWIIGTAVLTFLLTHYFNF